MLEKLPTVAPVDDGGAGRSDGRFSIGLGVCVVVVVLLGVLGVGENAEVGVLRTSAVGALGGGGGGGGGRGVRGGGVGARTSASVGGMRRS